MIEQNVVDGSSQNQNVAAPPAVQSEQPTEKSLPQSHVNDLIGRAKSDAYEKGKRDALQGANPQPSVTMGGMTQQSPDDIRRMVAEETQKTLSAHQEQLARQQQEEYSKGVTNQFLSKMQVGTQAYPDFEEKVLPLNLPTLPHVVHLSNSMDNTADVIYDLANNPLKAEALEAMAKRNPQGAYQEMQKLSASIKQNKTAANFQSPNDPLSQIKTSPTGIDNGLLSVSDRRKSPALRA
jgi:hypothetical protein